jgi:hypothetical protein
MSISTIQVSIADGGIARLSQRRPQGHRSTSAVQYTEEKKKEKRKKKEEKRRKKKKEKPFDLVTEYMPSSTSERI